MDKRSSKSSARTLITTFVCNNTLPNRLNETLNLGPSMFYDDHGPSTDRLFDAGLRRHSFAFCECQHCHPARVAMPASRRALHLAISPRRSCPWPDSMGPSCWNRPALRPAVSFIPGQTTWSSGILMYCPAVSVSSAKLIAPIYTLPDSHPTHEHLVELSRLRKVLSL
jgi:hypothetical protein